MIIEGNKLTAEDGMILTNGEVYSGQVYLGIHDSVSNWTEIPAEDEPDDEPDIDDSEALSILLGGAV